MVVQELGRGQFIDWFDRLLGQWTGYERLKKFTSYNIHAGITRLGTCQGMHKSCLFMIDV